MSIDVVELAKKLISRRSVTPDDAGCIDLLCGYLEPLGFECEKISRGGVDNLWARRGTASPVVCFAGHTDVVPTGPLDQWHSDPFTPTVRDGVLYGRGASDMKSSLAAFVVAIDEFVAPASRPPGLDSQCCSLPTRKARRSTAPCACARRSKDRSEKLDYCIVGEPTCGRASWAT